MAFSTLFIDPAECRHPGWFEPRLFQRASTGPLFDSTFGGLHDRMGHSGRSDKAGARPGGRDVLGRTSHVDIQPVEPKLAYRMRSLIKQLRIVPVKLRHHRTLDLA